MGAHELIQFDDSILCARAAFSYWLAHPDAATHMLASFGLNANLTLEPGHATAAMFGLSGNSLVDWAAAKVPALQKEIPVGE